MRFASSGGNSPIVAERVDVPLGQDEQVRVGLRVDVADRDEAVARARRGRPRGRACRRGSRQAARTPSSVDGGAAHADELADRRVDEPRRVVVAVAAARAVDEHDVLARRPSRASGARHALVREARSRALRSRFTAGGTVSRAAVAVPGRGEYGKTCTFVIPASRTDRERSPERGLVLGGEADDHVGRQVEVGERLEPAEEGRGRCSGGPSRAGRRRRRTAAARAGGARRPASRAAR